MTQPPRSTPRFGGPGRITLQLIGFAIGVVLLVLVIRNAFSGDGWESGWTQIRSASSLHVALLIASSLVSLALNGAAFWITIRPVRSIAMWDLQRVNVVGNMLNYLPIRIGAICRVLYHVRVDRLTILQVGGWFALLGGVLVLGISAFLLATWLHDDLDLWWLLIALAIIAGGTLVGRALARTSLINRFGTGVDAMVSDPRSLWGVVGLRVVDMGAYAVRMYAAVKILDLQLPPAHVVVLSVIALAASLVPIGRIGIREWSVAQVAILLSLSTTEAETQLSQLALLESAGEALVFIPLGVLAAPWFLKRLLRSR